VKVKIVSGSTPRRLIRLFRHFRDDDIDLVHSWLFIANAAAGYVQLFSPRRALITAARNRKRQGHINWIANMVAFRLSRTIIVNSNDVRDYIVENYRAPAGRIRRVANGIDIERFRPAPRVDLESPRIVSIGRLVEQKNHELFLNAAADLRRNFPTARFEITGEGPLRSALERQARDLGLADAVHFLGERADVESVLSGASLFWLTSRWEGMPNVLLEAMACGVPVLATDVGGAHELIDEGKCGFVLQSGDGAGFVKRSEEVLSDKRRWTGMAQAARRRAETFSLDAMVLAMEQIYEEALS